MNVSNTIRAIADHILAAVCAADDVLTDGMQMASEITTACELARQAARRDNDQEAFAQIELALRYFYGARTQEYVSVCTFLGMPPCEPLIDFFHGISDENGHRAF